MILICLCPSPPWPQALTWEERRWQNRFDVPKLSWQTIRSCHCPGQLSVAKEGIESARQLPMWSIPADMNFCPLEATNFRGKICWDLLFITFPLDSKRLENIAVKRNLNVWGSFDLEIRHWNSTLTYVQLCLFFMITHFQVWFYTDDFI